jgi:multiple sugar transport system ATP-binding protein
MSDLTIRNLKKSFEDIHIIKGIDLDIKDHEFVVFVGPSGCGKSTLLRLIAGLEEVTSGHIQLDERDITDVAPAKRDLAMVFQSYALYPHMTVRKNMSFALDLAGIDKAEIQRKVDDAAKVLELGPLLERKPKALSGGQRQRVAIGRAIVRNPKIFLFDEPLSNLDAALRVLMRLELARLHKELNATMIYVTHDQVEAMTLADKVVVLNAGRVEQVGSPLELYHHHRPASTNIQPTDRAAVRIEIKYTSPIAYPAAYSHGQESRVAGASSGIEDRRGPRVRKRRLLRPKEPDPARDGIIHRLAGGKPPRE